MLSRSWMINDTFYGELRLDARDGVLDVSGDQVPTVIITRSPEAECKTIAPIGTRVATSLSVTVDGVEAELLPGKAAWTRHSHRVDLTHAGTGYALVPNSAITSRLIRDGATIAEFCLVDDGEFVVRWLTAADDARPADAAIGYVLSVAFGTGAERFLSLLVKALLGDSSPVPPGI
jgi:hypothetical protein